MKNKPEAEKANVFTLSKVALMSAVICVLGPLSISIPISPVPVTLGIIGILLSVYVLGWELGLVSLAIYLLLGTFGVPVFSNFSGGFAKIAGPTGGYMIGYILLVIVSGIFIEKFDSKKYMQFIGIMLGVFACYALGTVWLKVQSNMTFKAALLAGTLPYIPFDVLKAVVCVFFGNKLKTMINKKSNRNE